MPRGVGLFGPAGHAGREGGLNRLLACVIDRSAVREGPNNASKYRDLA